MRPPLRIDRRRVLVAGSLTAGAALMPGCGTGGVVPDAGRTDVQAGDRPPAPSDTLPATPACQEGAARSPSQTEGPYYKPSSPERGSLLEPGIAGTRLILEGFVVTPQCRPIANAVVDLWHCDGNGEYDNSGFRLRGFQRTDESGLYRFETVLPGIYPGRTRHFHVKVGVPGAPTLTTQLYFPGEAANARDSIFHEALVVTTEPGVARFTFVVA